LVRAALSSAASIESALVNYELSHQKWIADAMVMTNEVHPAWEALRDHADPSRRSPGSTAVGRWKLFAEKVIALARLFEKYRGDRMRLVELERPDQPAWSIALSVYRLAIEDKNAANVIAAIMQKSSRLVRVGRWVEKHVRRDVPIALFPFLTPVAVPPRDWRPTRPPDADPDRGAILIGDDLRLLEALKEAHPRAVLISDLEIAVTISRRTLPGRLKYLIEKGLAWKPRGPRKGTAISAEGISLLTSLTVR